MYTADHDEEVRRLGQQLSDEKSVVARLEDSLRKETSEVMKWKGRSNQVSQDFNLILPGYQAMFNRLRQSGDTFYLQFTDMSPVGPRPLEPM